MSDPETRRNGQEKSDPAPETAEKQGPSLTLLYSIFALALGAAIFLALTIVYPFWHRQ